jgi:hypothetical protein
MDRGTGGDAVPDQEEGWFADPEQEGQERFWDGEGWTAEVRPDGSADAGLIHLPDHVPELQRALAAATEDIDSVEDRLSTLFDRAEGQPPGYVRPPRPRQYVAESIAANGDGTEAEGDEEIGDVFGEDGLLLEDFDEEPAVFDDEDDDDGEVGGVHAEFRDEDDEDEDDEFADLDAALAAESPEEL